MVGNDDRGVGSVVDDVVGDGVGGMGRDEVFVGGKGGGGCGG